MEARLGGTEEGGEYCEDPDRDSLTRDIPAESSCGVQGNRRIKA